MSKAFQHVQAGWLEVGGTYMYNGWVFVVIRELGPSGVDGSLEALCLTDYGPSVIAGHLIEVTQNSAVAAYSVRIA